MSDYHSAEFVCTSAISTTFDFKNEQFHKSTANSVKPEYGG